MRPPLCTPPAAFDHRPLKMSRFSAGSAEQSCRFAECKRSKIGTFLNAGWRCGGWILKEGAFARSASLRRLLWGTFLAETRKVQYDDKRTTLPIVGRVVEFFNRI